MATKPQFLLTLAACGSGDFHWPESSLHDVRHYDTRVDEDCKPADEPAGDCPVTGALCYAEDRYVPIYWLPLNDAIRELNDSGRALAAYLAFPSGRGGVTIRVWSTPRKSYDENDGVLQDIVVKPNREAVASAVCTIEALTNKKSQVASLLHITWDINVPSILRDGLVPNRRPNRWAVSEANLRSIGASFLCTDARLPYWQMTYSDGWVRRPTLTAKLVVLRVLIPECWVRADHAKGEAYAGDFRCTRTIPPANIALLTGKGVSRIAVLKRRNGRPHGSKITLGSGAGALRGGTKRIVESRA